MTDKILKAMLETHNVGLAAKKLGIPYSEVRSEWLKMLPKLVEQYGSTDAVSDVVGMSARTLRHQLGQTTRKAEDTFEFPQLSSSELPIEELISQRIKLSQRKIKAHKDRHLIRIKVKENAPIGLAFVGDPHTDDDGTDLEKLFEHADIIRETDGMWGVNVGDNHNLWVGRLMRKYADQASTMKDGWRITEELIRRVPWLALIKGNHDHWTGGSDPLEWIVRDLSAVFEPYDVRICLVFPNGFEFKIWLRHDFPGHSQWNDLHALVKAGKMGSPFDLFVAGHKHTSAHHAEYNFERGAFWHAVRCGSYKMVDDYPQQLGLRDGNIFQCPVAIIDPNAKNPTGVCKIEYDPSDGADRLNWMRSKGG